MTPAGLTFHDRTYDGTTVVTPVGRLDLTTCHLMRTHLLKVATDSPRAVIVDLGDLVLESQSSLAVFVGVHARLAEWPDVPLLLVPGCPQIAETLARGRVGHFVPVRSDVRSAVDAVGDPPPRRLSVTWLANQPTSPHVAREFAKHTCADWDVRQITDDAVIVTSELVANAVVHTTCDPRLRLELRRGVFSVAVYDDVPGDVAVREPGPGLADLHGLLLVAQIATAWGCSPTPGGGKVVWATLGIHQRVRC